MPKVSVITNCLNGKRYLRKAIDSVFAQTFDDWEIIFWDNASTDESGEIARSYGDRLRYFRSERTYSLGKARNLAFAQARGDLIAILDVDDVWLPNKLEKQVELFNRNPQLCMVFSNFIFFNEDGDKSDMFKFSKPMRGRIFGDLLRNNFISTGAMMYKKSILESMDYIFDDDFTMAMDYDLSLRIAYYYEVDYVDEPLSKWRMHRESESSRKRLLIPQESLKMLEKLIKNLPGMEERFEEEIKDFKKKVDYQYAIAEWNNGNKKIAKNYLKPHLNNRKFLITFILMHILSLNQFENLKLKLKYLLR